MDGYALDIVKFETKFIDKIIPYKVKVMVPETVTEIIIEADGTEREVSKTIEKAVEETRTKVRKEAVDIVHYAQVGCRQRTVVPARISSLSAIQDGDGDTQKMARDRWDFIKPRYEAWKAGHTIGVEPGKTPLGAWPALTPEMAEQFRMMGLYTVESVAAASDGVLARCPIPNARELQKQAKLFLEAADKQAVTHEIAAMRDENDELKSQIAELKRMFVEMANKEESSTPAASEKPRRTQKSAEVAA
jgi:hypothetical protein